MSITKIDWAMALSLAVALLFFGTALAPATASAEGASASMTAPTGQSVNINAPPANPPAPPPGQSGQGSGHEPPAEGVQPEEPKYQLLSIAMAGPNARVVADALSRVTPAVGPIEFPNVPMDGLEVYPNGSWDLVPTKGGQPSPYLQAIARHHGLLATFFRGIYIHEGDDIAREVGLPQNNGGKAGNGAVMRLNAVHQLMAVQWGLTNVDPSRAFMKLASWPNGLQMQGKPKISFTKKVQTPRVIQVPPGRLAFLSMRDFEMALGSYDGIVLSRSKVNKDARPPGGPTISLFEARNRGVLVFE